LNKTVKVSCQPLQLHSVDVRGYITHIDGDAMYCIENFDMMDPFLMTIVSSSDLWMYISSRGGLTAGRQNCNNALFPYDTDDKIHLAGEHTGAKTIIRVESNGELVLWEPFSDYYKGIYKVQRDLYKNCAGDKIVFRETNFDLQLVFSYSWMSSERLGWVRKSKFENISNSTRILDITDGLQNIIPYGITRDTHASLSTLMDAYKVSEWIPNSGLALYRMSSIPVDRAEPSEALKANTLWVHGLNKDTILLSSQQLKNLRLGVDISSENLIYGQKNSFFVHDKLELKANDSKEWYIVADVSKDHSEIALLKHSLETTDDIADLIENSISESNRKMHHLVGLSDGIQLTGDELNDRRHFANVMFNIMRGGVFANDYKVEISDLLEHLKKSNKRIYESYKPLIDEFGEIVELDMLYRLAETQSDLDLIRLIYEYLPLTFSRRHGDPSRPWNFFDIQIKTPDGKPSFNYQGNWRDIFQNWEALAYSFPYYLPGMICRFLNASTADGYNPYRITRQGFDWEVPEPDNPWAFIGYWGDHQIVYLLRLMELCEKFYPGRIYQTFERPLFVYARVPYKIKSYTEIKDNPQDTIVFDFHLHESLMQATRESGSDAKLNQRDHSLVRATFTEKILVSLLTKLSNFIPEAGIWLNTQRPEWNDANNALVGNGASMVTLFHLRRYVNFLLAITKDSPNTHFSVCSEAYDFFNQIDKTLLAFKSSLNHGFTDVQRMAMTDQLGIAGGEYRASVYRGFAGESRTLSKSEIINFYSEIISYLDQSIKCNRRDDGLYHSYNLIEFENNKIKVKHLDLMLEGQVAALSSGITDTQQTLEILETLFSSKLWRDDQQSFMLYPFKELPQFLDKNIIPDYYFNKSYLLKELIAIGNTQIVNKDIDGKYHFNGSIVNARVLNEKLLELTPLFGETFLKTELPVIMEIYEAVFDHKSFTGRSGSFYKYEGLGSIYWHMVSKLLLAVGENIVKFDTESKDSEIMKGLKVYYYRIREGIGVHKNPAQYGAFPTDPYSHTPSMMGAQQPGLTGQVKEDVLSRFNELGLTIRNSQINFSPVLLRDLDFTQNGELNFTFCNTTVTVKKGEKIGTEIYFTDSEKPNEFYQSLSIPIDRSNEIFNRGGVIRSIAFVFK